MQNINGSQASPEIPINENFTALSCFQVYAMRAPVTTGLTWGYYGGRWGGSEITDGTFTLDAYESNYVVVEIATGASTCSIDDTNWYDATNFVRVYLISTDDVSATAIEDHRVGPGGVFG